MKTCFGYVRVSTQKQGEGVSLDAQKDAILAFAARNNIEITQWFEEKETAAKSGRPLFNTMIKELLRHHADGVVLHKIDRGARNLADWAKFAELADAGIDVHFATETLDFRSRGGRLTADIQAVIAADYIRNLREETIKGLTGRLKQGFYPFKAPIGYRDNGGGKVKTIDPVRGAMVRQLFALYATGQYSLHSLVPEVHRLNLRNDRGNLITKSGIEKLLQNPFYCGLMRVKTTGMTYEGTHEPLISASIFERVQAVRAGKSGKKVTKHLHLFRGLFQCATCHRAMIAERQKGHVYYRCHTPHCLRGTVREEVLVAAFFTVLNMAQLSPEVLATIDEHMTKYSTERATTDPIAPLRLQLVHIDEKLGRLTDALIDRLVDQSAYVERRQALLMEKASIEERIADVRHAATPDDLRNFLELLKSLPRLYEIATDDEKRQIVETTTSNRMVSPNGVCIEPASWLMETRDCLGVSGGALPQPTPRSSHDMLDAQMERLLECAKRHEVQRLIKLINLE